MTNKMKTLAGHTPQKFTTHTLEHNHLKKALYTYTNTPPGLVQPYAQPTTPTHHPPPIPITPPHHQQQHHLRHQHLTTHHNTPLMDEDMGV